MTPQEQAELAKKFGGVPAGGGGDAELASKFGGVPSQPISLTPGTPGSEIPGRIAGAIGENINPMPLLRAATPQALGGVGPVETVKGMWGAMTGAGGRAAEALKKGQYGEAAKSAIGAVPVVGPAAEQITREATEGKIPEAIGHAGGIALASQVPGLVGKALSRGAEPIAESALGIRPINRAYGRTPGRAALEETSGFNPSVVAASAKSKLGQLTPELEKAARTSNAPVNLQSTIDVIDAALARAARENNAPEMAQLSGMKNQLTGEPTPGFRGALTQGPTPMVPKTSAVLGPNGQPLVTMVPGTPPPPTISRVQPAEAALNLKRGFGDVNVHNWNPETMERPRTTAAKAYGTLGSEFEKAVPEAAELNQRVSSLIPVARRGEAVGRGADIGQRTLGRLAAHTGALTGAALGYSQGGIPGGLAGLVIPELLASPTGQMAVARALRGGGKALQTPLAKGAGSAMPFVRNEGE